jgi:hypothetical protein
MGNIVFYALLPMIFLLNIYEIFKFKIRFLEHMLIPIIGTSVLIVTLYTVFIGGETYKYISTILFSAWALSSMISLLTLKFENR